MAKVITQTTFDDVVKENIVDFSMTPSEARDETIKQFETQGVNLANIIKDLTINEETGVPVINECIDQLKNHITKEKSLDQSELIICLNKLRNELDKSVPHRVLAAKSGSQEVLVTLIELELFENDNEVTTADQSRQINIELLTGLLDAYCSLIKQQPDIFDPETLVISLKIMDKHSQHNELVKLVLQILNRACVMHEINRQNIMNAEIVKYLKPFLNSDDTKLIKNLCLLFRYLILDDDVRVEFGKAHEHAKILAAEVLIDATKLLEKFKENQAVQSDLILTIAALTVRNEFCLVVDEAGGLKSVLDAMKTYSEIVKFQYDVFQLLRALAGNDVIKSRIIQLGAAPLITDILCIHKANEPLAKAALMCIATLTLRSKENSQALCDAKIAEEIVTALKLHPTSKAVQRNGSWAIRNIVSRSRELCDLFLIHGAEEVLNEGMTAHPSVAQDIKSALRDLGCKVQLKEEWTGTSTVKFAN